MHLRYSLEWFGYENEEGIKEEHPMKMMENLGITYKHGVPQSIGAQWWFLDCENIPNPLPPYLEEMKLDEEEYKHWTKIR